MTEHEFKTYQTLLIHLSQTLASLTEIEQKKTTAVRSDDLFSLNECMKREQALTMKLRGYEQRQKKLHNDMGLGSITLRELKEHVPVEFRLELKETVKELRRQYELFFSAFEIARNTLECNLHQVQQVLTQLGQFPVGDEQIATIPDQLCTDLRA